VEGLAQGRPARMWKVERGKLRGGREKSVRRHAAEVCRRTRDTAGEVCRRTQLGCAVARRGKAGGVRRHAAVCAGARNTGQPDRKAP
jgi:hypothetical protein